MSVVFYVAGVATGWIARGTVDSSRGLVVAAIAAAHAAADRVKRWGAMEREYIEDLFAEGKAQFEAEKQRSTAPRSGVPTSSYVQ